MQCRSHQPQMFFSLNTIANCFWCNFAETNGGKQTRWEILQMERKLSKNLFSTRQIKLNVVAIKYLFPPISIVLWIGCEKIPQNPPIVFCKRHKRKTIAQRDIKAGGWIVIEQFIGFTIYTQTNLSHSRNFFVCV